MNALVGTPALIRFIVRRHWLRIAIWVASIAAMVLATAASVEGLYPTQEALDQAAAASEDNAAALFFNGPAQGLDNTGGQIAFQVGAFGFAVVGLMSVLMIGALTRGEEESGRMEMVRSLPVGAHAPPVAAFFVVGAMSVAIGAIVTASMLLLGLAGAGSLSFGLAFALTGFVFAGVASVTTQLSENTRVAYGVGGVVLGAAFLLRAIGDVTDGTLSWLSPIGLMQKARPFAGEQWLPLVAAVIVAAALFAIGAFLSERRDLAAGLVPPRPGPPAAGALLSSTEGLAVRLHRGSVVAWALGALAVGAAYGSIGESIEDFINDNEAMLELMARAGADVDIVSSYLATSFQILCLTAAAFGIQVALRIRTEEVNLLAEPVLATPVPRWRWALGHLGVAGLGSVLVVVTGGLAVGLSYGMVTGNYGRTYDMFRASMTYVPAIWALIGFAAVLVGALPRFTALAWAMLGFVFVVAMFGDLLGLPQWARNVSPVSHVPLVPAAGFSWSSFVALIGVGLALTVAGVGSLTRRDVGA